MTSRFEWREKAKGAIRAVVPAFVRKPIAVWLGHQRWLPDHRSWSVELLADLAETDPNAYHRFLWSHHMGYAATYEVERRFGERNLHPSRRMLFEDLVRFLRLRGTDPSRDIRSVLEVGCSTGHLLRYLEEAVVRRARTIDGIDIDKHAIRVGTEHLERLGSRVRLTLTDMDRLDEILAGKSYDLTLGAGVLMYLNRTGATAVVASMLAHTKGILVLAGLAHPGVDNRTLSESTRRQSDGTFVHNFDAMVALGGGRVLYRRWEGPREVDGNTIYFVFASPPGPGRSDA